MFIRHLQFVHQVVAQVLRDVLVPVLPHAERRGRLGRGHRTHASRVVHQPLEEGGGEKKNGEKIGKRKLRIECLENVCIHVQNENVVCGTTVVTEHYVLLIVCGLLV